MHRAGIDSELFGSDAHTGPPGSRQDLTDSLFQSGKAIGRPSYGRELVVAGCHTATMLDLIEEPLDQISGSLKIRAEAKSQRGTVTDLLLRQAEASRAGAQGDDDYDVVGTGGLVVGRIFKATTSPAGTPWMWTLAYADHEDRTPTHGYEVTREAAMQAIR